MEVWRLVTSRGSALTGAWHWQEAGRCLRIAGRLSPSRGGSGGWEHPRLLAEAWQRARTEEAMTVAEGHSFNLINVAALFLLQRAAFARDDVIRYGRCFSGEMCL